MRRTLRLLATTALATGLVVGASGTAFAQKTTVKDASGDVLRYADDEGASDGVALEDTESRASGADIKSFSVDHTKTRVKVSAKFRTVEDDTTIYVYFRLNGKSEPTRVLFNLDDEDAVVFQLSTGEVACELPISVKTGPNGTISASINRKCLGYPSKLRATVVADTETVDGSGDYYEDFLGNDDWQWTKSLKRG